MFDAMDFLMKDLMMQARLLKTAQGLNTNINNRNADFTLGSTSTYQSGPVASALNALSLPAMFVAPKPVTNLLWAAASPDQFSQGFDAIKQILPSAGAFRRDITLPDSF